MKFSKGDVVTYQPDGTKGIIKGIYNAEKNQYEVYMFDGNFQIPLGEGVLSHPCEHGTAVYHDRRGEWYCPFCNNE